MVAKKRPGKRRKTGRRRSWPLGSLAVALFGLGSLVATFYFVFLWQVDRRQPAKISIETPPLVERAPVRSPPPKLIDATEYKQRPADGGEAASKARPAAVVEPAPPGAGKARVAIVIDDMGFQEDIGEQLLALPLNLSFAFLPHAPHSKAQATMAKNRGRDVLLHLPMEPEDQRWDPGPGALFTDMSGPEIREIVSRDLATVPFVIGINNHMGSRFTRDEAAMTAVLEVARAEKLFFLDSLTAAASVAYAQAGRLGVKTGRRRIFLDNEAEVEKIGRQLDELVAAAERDGEAIGIGHPRPPTLAALQGYQDRFGDRVTVVGVHALMR